MQKAVILGLLFVVAFAGLGLGKEIVVTSTADSGSGTLRWALEMVHSGDVITFDATVFPPDAPATIHLRSVLPPIGCGHLTVDASDEGVILDGSGILARGADGLFVSSDWNTIRGLQIIGFPANGIVLDEGAQQNRIGGDRGIGSGPMGQGNLLSSNGGRGIGLWGAETSFNTVEGNIIGNQCRRHKAMG